METTPYSEQLQSPHPSFAGRDSTAGVSDVSDASQN